MSIYSKEHELFLKKIKRKKVSNLCKSNTNNLSFIYSMGSS